MEIIKTYDLEKLKEIVSKEISVGLSSGRDHARINLISAQEISEILAECIVRENPNCTFVEKEHPETVMIEGEIEHYIRIIEDKEREINDHHEQIKCLSERNEELEKEVQNWKEKYRALTEIIIEE